MALRHEIFRVNRFFFKVKEIDEFAIGRLQQMKSLRPTEQNCHGALETQL